MTKERSNELSVERDILISEIQRNPDIPPGDKDHLRHAINSAYDAAESDDISELAVSNVVWSRINLRTFASVQKLVGAVATLSTDIRNHVSATPPVPQKLINKSIHAIESTRFERRLNAVTRLARVAAWPACLIVGIIATALILRPELAKIAEAAITAAANN